MELALAEFADYPWQSIQTPTSTVFRVTVRHVEFSQIG
jgi:hypothetical protein